MGRHASRESNATLDHLGDFTTTRRVLPISGLAAAIGVFAALVAAALLKLIGLFTNLFFFQRVDTALVSPAGHHLGVFVVLVPVAGALVIGVMARYGSERIRGHGIPEAIEAILINGSRVEPKVALLKPLSSAISIGSGGPFGAEGPIIMTGGAFGSLIAQFFHLTSAERKTLLVAGAAAGMSATFAAPVASVMLAVELLLFEWKPRSLIPVALASVTAAAVRRHILGLGPIFPVPVHPTFIGAGGLLGCVIVGALAGALSALLTGAVYASEDAFSHLPIHWMWWPAIGGLTIGIGGFFFPQALGVGYDVIGGLLQGDMPTRIIVGVLVVKSAIWAISLGSGTSGGVLAPLLMIGGALGGLEARLLPWEGAGFWPLVSMGAILGGTMRSPLTGVVFVLELTHDVNVMLPLLLAVTIAHGFTVLALRRSILTEKVARRGFHLSREYAIDPLEIIFAREVVRTSFVALAADASSDVVAAALGGGKTERQRQRLFPVVDAGRRLVGVVTRSGLRQWLNAADGTPRHLRDVIEHQPVVAYEDEPLRVIVFRMAETGLTRLPVIARRDGTLVGMLALTDLLIARARILEAEQRRERVLGGRLRLFDMFGRGRAA
ncbi:MAG: chloride channel protein [Acidobacteria bacterium]|nr:MAG: chloride channel protein [Acidobacteriota bacterium]PYQ84105.1 MAG: chloride channel protein [Acidobacteriota bacterium]PYR11032.1 MAG: chloride channel protein [Acidobacteriota bacterium]